MPARTLGVLIAVAFAAAPGTAAGQGMVLGSPLTAEPNVALGCETQPTLTDSSGNYALAPSNQPSCTWRQSGVFGVSDYSDPRTSSVPADGRITSIAVRSGPNPAQLRFVILRQLAQPDNGSACCFFVSETEPVQPQPNTVTTFATNLTVVRNVDADGVLAADLVGVSAVSGTGSLPLHSTGQHNAFQLTQPGSVNAGAIYPRIGAQPSDSNGGGRSEAGLPGWEVLMQWTWCPDGQTCGDEGGLDSAAVGALVDAGLAALGGA